MFERDPGPSVILHRHAVPEAVGIPASRTRFMTQDEIESLVAPTPHHGRSIDIEPFEAGRRGRAKAAFTTRRVGPEAMATLVSGSVRPRAGDVVLARVDRTRQHARLELRSGRKAQMHAGDEIIVVYANRYAPDQFEAQVPRTLGSTHLVAAGGIAADVLSHSDAVSPATEISPIGLVGDVRGVPLNVGDFGLQPLRSDQPRPRTIAVVGTSMNSGKTTTNRFLVNGLSRAGLAPGAVKVTGTGAGGDYWIMEDAGAHRVLDFTDVGLASTYMVPLPTLVRKFLELIQHLTEAGCGVILIEVADGIYQRETARLIESEAFRTSVDGVIFAAGEAMGAAAGVEHLRRLGLPVLGVSGKLTMSPLAMREAAAACGVPVFASDVLLDPEVAPTVVGVRPPALAPELLLPLALAGAPPAAHSANGSGPSVIP
jgi:hypothetical protein